MRSAHAITGKRGFETVGWILAACLLALAFWLPEAAEPARFSRLLAVVAGLSAMNLLGHRLLPQETEGASALRRDDALLFLGLGMTLLLTVYLALLPDASSSLDALFLLPLIAAALAMDERLVVAEAAISVMAMLVLRAAEAAPYWTSEFPMRLIAFGAVSACLAVMTAGMRRMQAEAERFSGGMARRIGELQALSALARQGAMTHELDRLAAKTGRIIADAVGSERCAVYLRMGGQDGALMPFGGASLPERLDREALALEENAAALRGALATGTSRILGAVPGGSERLRDALIVPLLVRQAPIGVLCLLNRREAGGFRPEEAAACVPLAGFAAGVLEGARRHRQAEEERRGVEKLSRLLVGRETKMRELKRRARETTRV